MNKIQYVFIKTEPNLYTVGFYDPMGNWHSESDHETKEQAGQRVHYLMGGTVSANPELLDALQRLLVWAELMGSWDSPCWDTASKLVAKLRESNVEH